MIHKLTNVHVHYNTNGMSQMKILSRGLVCYALELPQLPSKHLLEAWQSRLVFDDIITIPSVKKMNQIFTKYAKKKLYQYWHAMAFFLTLTCWKIT